MTSIQVKRRCSIDLNSDTSASVSYMTAETGLSTAALFRAALVLLSVCIDAIARGKQVVVSDPKSGDRTLVVLPMIVKEVSRCD
jgi:hypothetical protein